MGKIYTASAPFYMSFKQFIPQLEVFPYNMDAPQKSLEHINEEDIDLIIFTGGEDISPSIYNKRNSHSFPTLSRDFQELTILKMALAKRIPVFGVCRGHQLLLGSFGLSLCQDLYFDGITHDSFHEVNNRKGFMERFYLDGVNSLHHQGLVVSNIPNSYLEYLDICGEHNNIVEAFECDFLRAKGTQFHPEFMGEDSIEFFQYITTWARSLSDRKEIYPSVFKTISNKVITSFSNIIFSNGNQQEETFVRLSEEAESSSEFGSLSFFERMNLSDLLDNSLEE